MKGGSFAVNVLAGIGKLGAASQRHGHEGQKSKSLREEHFDCSDEMEIVFLEAWLQILLLKWSLVR